MSLGVLRRDGDSFAVSFERRLAAPPEEVWDAVTDADRLARWFTRTTIEPRVGGAVLVDFGAEGSAGGEVLEWDPPRAYAFRWVWEGVNTSVLRIELGADGDGTLLRLEHRGLSAPLAADHGSGWHAYLDGLADLLAGTAGSWAEREERVRPEYERLFSRLA